MIPKNLEISGIVRSQQDATAVYRSELAARLTALGYEIERGRSGQPEIHGYSRELRDARQVARSALTAGDRDAERCSTSCSTVASATSPTSIERSALNSA